MRKLALLLTVAVIALVVAGCGSSAGSTDDSSGNAPDAIVFIPGTTNIHLDGVYCYHDDSSDEPESSYIRFFNDGRVCEMTQKDSDCTPETAYELLDKTQGSFHVSVGPSYTFRGSLVEDPNGEGNATEVEGIEFAISNAEQGKTWTYVGTVNGDSIEFVVETAYEDESLFEFSGLPEPETRVYDFVQVNPSVE